MAKLWDGVKLLVKREEIRQEEGLAQADPSTWRDRQTAVAMEMRTAALDPVLTEATAIDQRNVDNRETMLQAQMDQTDALLGHPRQPDETGEALDQDVAKAAPDLAKWKREDEDK